jgi:hypothetical protein
VSKDIPPLLIQTLIRAGKAEDVHDAFVQLFPAALDEAALDYIHGVRSHWEEVCRSLTKVEFAALIRALTIAWEVQYGSYGGGSTSPVILVYPVFKSRFPRAAPPLADWIFAHTSNSGYLHFPESKLGAPERKALERLRGEVSAQRARLLEVELAHQGAARAAKVVRATLNLPNAVRRGDVKAVEALLARGADPLHPGPDGRTALDFAREAQNATILELLLRSSDGA